MNDLKDRYVAAVLRATRDDRRVDVEGELKAAIDDAVEARIEAGVEPDQAVREALTELGDPARLAADYSDRPLWLIGPTYYLAWQRALVRLLTVVPVLAGSVNAVVRSAMGDSGLDALLAGTWVAFIAAINVVVWTTLIFVVAERSEESHKSDIETLTRWTVDRLPSTTASQRQFSLLETIGGLVVGGIAIAFLLSLRTNVPIAAIDSAAWTVAVPVFVGLLFVSIFFRMVKYRVGRWTPVLAAANTVINVAYAACWTWLLLAMDLISADYFAESDLVDWLTPTLLVNLAVVVAILGWDSFEGFQGVRRSRRERVGSRGV